MTTGASVSVYVDGVQAADGCNNDGDFEQPTVLDNLAVTWGRSDTMSQPQADVCTFEIMDASGAGFMSTFRTGSRIDVYASGVVDESASTPTFVNPGFETATVTWATTGGTAARTTQRALSGAYSLNVRPSAPNAPTALLLAPAPFSASGADPDAWDDIPTTQLGETWTLNVALWLPTGATAQIVPVLFSGPYVASAVPVAGPPRILTGNDAWQTDTHLYTVEQQAARWLGMQITLSPAGRAWDEMPPALAWDAVDPSLSWDDFGTMFVDNAQITSPATPSAASVLVFSGRVTELSSAWDDAANAAVVSVAANGFTADLENRRVGDEPWNVESVDARANRILDLAGLPITIDIDTSIDETLLSWRDVDSQGALGLLQSVAVSVDAVLWPAVHSAIGAYLRMEDPAMRASLLRLSQLDGPPPVVLRHNWQPNPVPASLTGFSRAGTVTSTVTFETTGGPAESAGRWIKNAITNATAGTDNQINLAGQLIGQLRYASGWVWSSKSLRVRFSAWTYDAAGAYLGSANDLTTAVIGFAVPANTWTFVSGALTGGATPYTRFLPFLRIISSTPVIAPDVYGIASITLADAAGDPFNGSTPDTPERDFAWVGAANASTSTESTVQTHTIVIVETDPDAGVNITACDVLRDPVTWVQSVADISTRVYVTWKEQGVNEEGLPTTTDVTESEIDAALEVRHGTRSVSVSTELQSATDAQSVAGRVLTRTSSDAWRAGGLTIDDEDLTPGDDTEMLLFLLDGTSRIGMPVVLTDLPDWTPGGTRTGTYLEGGTYSFVGGRWVLQLIVSSASAGLGASAAWDELNPAWQWNQWDPDITWNDLHGVSA